MTPEEEERKKLAVAIVAEFWARLALEIGNSILKKVMWGLVLLAFFVAYVKFPLK